MLQILVIWGSHAGKFSYCLNVGASQPAAKKLKIEGNKDDLFGGDANKGTRKRTEEGYAIYSEEELRLANSKGGDTDLCPFDCDCCY